MSIDKKRTIPQSMRNKISKAMRGNKNAEVWTDKLVLSILNKMIDVLEQPYEVEIESSEEEKEVIGKAVVDENGDIENDSKGYTKKKVSKSKRRTHLKHDLLVMFKIRYPKWFPSMRRKAEDGKFEDNETVLNLLEYIDKTCMSNTYNDAANGSTNSTMAKMSLSTHYNWSDRVESKVEHSGEVQIEKPEVPEHIRKAYEQASTYVDNDET